MKHSTLIHRLAAVCLLIAVLPALIAQTPSADPFAAPANTPPPAAVEDKTERAYLTAPQPSPVVVVVTNAVSERPVGSAVIEFKGEFNSSKTNVVEKEEKLIYTASSKTEVSITPKDARIRSSFRAEKAQGKWSKLNIAVHDFGRVESVTGKGVEFWGLKSNENGVQTVVVHFMESTATNKVQEVVIQAQRHEGELPFWFELPSVLDPSALAFKGTTSLIKEKGLTMAVDQKNKRKPSLYTTSSRVSYANTTRPIDYKVSVSHSDPNQRKVQLSSTELKGVVKTNHAAFTMTTTASIKHERGGSVELFKGQVSITNFKGPKGSRLGFYNGAYRLYMTTNGTFPVTVEFDAPIQKKGALHRVTFSMPPAPLRPVEISGLPSGIGITLQGAGTTAFRNQVYTGFLPPSGGFDLSWQQLKQAVRAALFFSVNSTEEIVVSPGLMKQQSVLTFQVMQGHMGRFSVVIDNPGEVTQLFGAHLKSWSIKPIPDTDQKRLDVQLTSSVSGHYPLRIFTQRSLGAFPSKVQPVRFTPENAIRFGGYLRVLSVGGVKLDVLESPGLTQISHDRFPNVKEMDKSMTAASNQLAQLFAYRYSGPERDLVLQADNILPELSVSEVLIYHMGETERRIEAEMELDIREAALRELQIEIPANYGVLGLEIPNLSDHSVIARDGKTLLQLQFSTPLTGRHLMTLVLSANQDEPPNTWEIPVIDIPIARNVQGHLGVAADEGLRLSASATTGLTDVASAFFPKKLPALQLTQRIRERNWALTTEVQREALSIQGDTLHLFSVGEGIVYGSSLMNFLIAGAPVSTFAIQSPTNVINVEFTGREIRDWKRTETGYTVTLHRPVSGSYSLLASWQTQFNPQGATMDFSGMAPENVQSEQGYVIVTSHNPFQHEIISESKGVIPIEPGEIPAEHRLLFDAPILSAHQFIGRPFELKQKLTLLPHGESISQVIDRAEFNTHISSVGQVLTSVRYLVKSKGESHLRLTLPLNTKTWDIKVQDKSVVSVKDGDTTLVPLPRDLPPDTIIPVVLEISGESPSPDRIALNLPAVDSPILLSTWKVSPDPGYRIAYRDGKVQLNSTPIDISGYAWLARLINGGSGYVAKNLAWNGFFALLLGTVVLRWATSQKRVRFRGRNLLGLAIGGGGILISLGATAMLAINALATPLQQNIELGIDLPYQVAQTTLSMNVATHELSTGVGLLGAWPIIFAAALWLYALIKDEGIRRSALMTLSWVIAIWAGLRSDHGAPMFFSVIIAFVLLHVVGPFMIRQFRLNPPSPDEPSDPSSAAGAAATLLIGALLSFGTTNAEAATVIRPQAVHVESIETTAQLQPMSTRFKSTLVWNARINEELTLLRSPAIPTSIDFEKTHLELYEVIDKKATHHKIVANKTGTYTIKMNWDIPLVFPGGSVKEIRIPLPIALKHSMTMTSRLMDYRLESSSIAAMSEEAIVETRGGMKQSHKLYQLTVLPVSNPSLKMIKIERDISAEETVFHADLSHLFIPNAGAIEGRHRTQIRVTQGVLKELIINTPDDLSITDLSAKNLSTWRFDPEEKKIRLQFDPLLTGENTLNIRSQITTQSLPYEHKTGFISVEGAISEIGKVGIATGPEVQLDQFTVESLTRINIEDFDQAFLKSVVGEFPTIRLRRASRYQTADGASVTLQASTVEPDIRVGENNSLSIGEDRMVLASRLTVRVQRAGIFKLTFNLPEDLDIESISSPSISHWTDLTTEGQRIVTLYLKEKTIGNMNIAATLSGQGLSDGAILNVPNIRINESAKQSGQLVIHPEQGMRLEITNRTGTTQLDPSQSGIRNKDARAFRLLQKDWNLTATIEKVDPWIQLISLQDLTVREGLLKATVQMQYKIENAGIKSLYVEVPGNAEAIRFQGEHIADTVQIGTNDNGYQEWEITLHRRVIGDYQLQLLYQTSSDAAASNTDLFSAHGTRLNLQRNFLTLRADGRIRIQPPTESAAVAQTDWESVPQELRRAHGGNEGSHTYRVLQTPFTLPVAIIRHETAEQLPARVESATIQTILTGSGAMLTQATLRLDPGDKRHLTVTLPKGALFWFASVNSVSARPWREGDNLLIPLEKPLENDQPTELSFTYSTPDTSRSLPGDIRLAGPSFDLPLKDIRWTIQLPEGRTLEKLSDAWQYEPGVVEVAQTDGLDSYLQSQISAKQAKTRKAETLLNFGNSLLQKGDQQRARKAFNSAYNLSQHDDAFNEDARVQLQNLKRQQALVGLVGRRGNAFAEQQSQQELAPVQLQVNSGVEGPSYSETDLNRVLANNSVELNGALVQLADQIITQQEATITTPEGIHAELPVQTHQHIFTRSIMVDDAPISIELQTLIHKTASTGQRIAFLFIMALLFATLALISRPTKMES